MLKRFRWGGGIPDQKRVSSAILLANGRDGARPVLGHELDPLRSRLHSLNFDVLESSIRCSPHEMLALKDARTETFSPKSLRDAPK